MNETEGSPIEFTNELVEPDGIRLRYVALVCFLLYLVCYGQLFWEEYLLQHAGIEVCFYLIPQLLCLVVSFAMVYWSRAEAKFECSIMVLVPHILTFPVVMVVLMFWHSEFTGETPFR